MDRVSRFVICRINVFFRFFNIYGHDKNSNAYLQAVYRSDPFFILQNADAGNLNYSGLSAYPLIILNEPGQILPGLAQQLQKYAERGGTLAIFPSLTADLGQLKNLLQTLGTDVPEEVVTQEAKVVQINAQHNLFAGVFERIPQKLDLPVAKKYIRYSLQSRTTRQSILELPGRRSFFSQYKIGRGSVYLSAVPLNDEASNFVRHSVFVPIMYQIALLSLRDNRLFYTLGKDQFLEISKVNPGINQTFTLKKQNFEVIPDIQQTENSTRLFIADQVQADGSYRLLKGDSVVSVFAFNDNRLESDLTYASNQELQTRFAGQKINIFNSDKGSLQNEVKAVNQGMQLWKLCLILALLSLAAEILLIRFYRINHPKAVVSV